MTTSRSIGTARSSSLGIAQRSQTGRQPTMPITLASRTQLEQQTRKSEPTEVAGTINLWEDLDLLNI